MCAVQLRSLDDIDSVNSLIPGATPSFSPSYRRKAETMRRAASKIRRPLATPPPSVAQCTQPRSGRLHLVELETFVEEALASSVEGLAESWARPPRARQQPRRMGHALFGKDPVAPLTLLFCTVPGNLGNFSPIAIVSLAWEV